MKNSKIFILSVLLLGLITYLLFSKIYNLNDFPTYAQELVAAFIGAYITVLITSLLLKHQSQNDLDKEKNVAVFNAKLNFYESFIDFLTATVLNDDKEVKMNEHEFKKWAMKISLICGKEISTDIDQFFYQYHTYRKISFDEFTLAEKESFKDWFNRKYDKKEAIIKDGNCNQFISLGHLIAHLKSDLGEVEIAKIENIASTEIAINHIIKS